MAKSFLLIPRLLLA